MLGGQQGVQRHRGQGVLLIVVLALQFRLAPFHPVEVGGDQIPLNPELVPLLRGGVLLLLKGQLSPEAVPGRGGRPEKVRSPLAGPLLPFPGVVKGVQQGGEALIPEGFHRAAVLSDGNAGKVQGLALPQEADGGEPALPDLDLERRQSLPEDGGPF